jgi:ankyrin repeat protein
MSLPKSPAARANLLIKWVTEGQAARAKRLLDREPELACANFYVACAVGEVEHVKKELRRDSKLAVTSGGPDNVAPLLYACCCGFLRLQRKLGDRIVSVAKELLAHGADPNSVFVTGPKNCRWRLTALYAAAGRANHAGLTQLLLEAGANPDDNESLYHSAEFLDLRCTRLLLKHGAKIPGTNAVHRKLDYDDLAGLRLFLDYGADPNLVGPHGNTPLHWAISNGRSVEFLELLDKRGANLRARNHEGVTPFQMASRLGHVEAVPFLTQRGAATKLEATDEFIAACARGDGRAAKSLLKQNPKLMKSLPAADRGLIAALAWRGKSDAIRVMLQVGFDGGATDKGGETALHTAAWKGYFETVKLLLKAGAPLEIKDSHYSATPMGWALHGAVNARDSEGNLLSRQADYAGIVEALLKAGAKLPYSLNDLKGALPPEVRAVLRRRSAG